MSLVVIGPSILNVRIVPAQPLQPGQPVKGQVRLEPDGAGRNMAEALARLDQNVSLLSVVGEDAAGRLLLESLARTGVDISRVRREAAGASAAAAAVTLAGTGNPATILDDVLLRQINASYLQDSADLLRIATALVIHTDAWLAFVQARPRLVLPEGIPLILTTRPQGVDTARGALSACNALFLNHDEAAGVCGQPVADVQDAAAASRWLLDNGPQLVVITLGAQGLLVASPAGVYHVPAVAGAVLDASGAGDVVVAGFLASWLNGDTLAQAACYASAAAGLAVGSSHTVPPGLRPIVVLDQIEARGIRAERLA